MNRRVLLLGLAVLLLGVVLAACGGGTPEAVDITVTTTDFAFDPVSLEVKAGQPVNLTLVNKGTQEHEWVVFKAGETISAPFDADDEGKIYWEMEAQPGETATGAFTAPSTAGTYEVVCGTAGHYEAGMKGTLVVK